MQPKYSGFTLIEVLVVLVLTSLISLALFSSFKTGIHSVQLAEAHINKMENSRQLINLIRRHLLNIETITLKDKHDVQVNSFEGEQTRIRYIAPLAMSAYDELYLIEIVTELDGNDGVWVRFGSYIMDLSADEIFQDQEFMLLSEHIEVVFEYYMASNKDDDAGEWLNDWTEPASTPLLIRMSVQEDSKIWPPLTLKVNSG